MKQEQMNNPYIPQPFTQMLYFADESSMEGSMGETYSGGDLWIWPGGNITFAKALEWFNNPEKTAKITAQYSKYESKTCEGYTKLTAIQTDPAGKMSIRLNRP